LCATARRRGAPLRRRPPDLSKTLLHRASPVQFGLFQPCFPERA